MTWQKHMLSLQAEAEFTINATGNLGSRDFYEQIIRLNSEMMSCSLANIQEIDLESGVGALFLS